MEELSGRAATAMDGEPAGRCIRYDFGLPGAVPVQRRFDEDIPGICLTQWVHLGIRYTQTVIVAYPESTGRVDVVPVLMIQLAGENPTSEYTNANAAFSVRVGQRPLEMEWRHGLVYATSPSPNHFVAAVEIGAEGVAQTTGPILRFHGDMPPGTSGAMTIKIPLGPVIGQEMIDRLRDLEFTDELRRVKRRWKSRPSEVTPTVAFAELTA